MATYGRAENDLTPHAVLAARAAAYDGPGPRTVAKQKASRLRRPMTAMTGTVADVQVGDYLDTVGGQGYRLCNVAALVHAINHDFSYTVYEGAVIGLTLLGTGQPIMVRPQVPATYRRFV